jgi:hypothetical protein
MFRPPAPVSRARGTRFFGAGYAEGMSRLFPASLGLCLLTAAVARAAPPACTEGARQWAPCELVFDWKDGEIPRDATPFTTELISVEFRSPAAKTFRLRAFPDGGHSLRVRFTPTEAGAWSYRITSPIQRYNDQEAQFNAASSSDPGFISVANLRHWWTEDKKPHLWLAAEVPWLDLSTAEFSAWVDARKADGFTHIRVSLLTASHRANLPFSGDGHASTPNAAYFAALDERLLYAQSQGFVTDLILADPSFVETGQLDNWESRELMVRYLVNRYAALNATWQGVAKFDTYIGARATLREIGSLLKQYDPYHHPRSTDAAGTSSGLLADGWMNYIMEGYPHPEVGAIEHQTTTQPIIHVVNAVEPVAFRRELWLAAMNTEYPSVSYAALQNPANVTALRAWFKVISITRHWETEPYFDVDGGVAMGLEEAEFVLYAEKPGHIEVSVPKHKYQPYWLNPITGDTIDVKDYKGEVFSQETPDSTHDWVLHLQREGHKQGMLKSYKFESQDVPVYEVEVNTDKIPFVIDAPAGDELDVSKPVTFQSKLRRPTRATRIMQYVWIGEIVADGEGSRILATGASGSFVFPLQLIRREEPVLNLRILGMNANGKVYELDKVFALKK